MENDAEKPTVQKAGPFRGRMILILVTLGLTGIIAFAKLFMFLLESDLRSHVSRTQADLRVIATGLELYWIHNKAYPTEAWLLTTPISYLSILPLDVESANGTEPYNYYTDGQGYIVISRGLDRVFQIDPERDFHSAENRDALAPALNDKCYDPSNGFKSAGDIFRSGLTERTVEERAKWEKENHANDQ